MAEHGSAEAALDALPGVASAAGVRNYAPCSAEDAEAEIEAGFRAGARLICYGEPAYPAGLMELVDALGAEGFTIVSGLARGIDTAAHAASLETGTIAVMAGGVDVVYPAENGDLARKILGTGLRISEQPFGMEPRARHFPARNRIISGLAQALIVVEAAVKSGSLITARAALDQGREVMAVPGHPLEPRASGCNQLLRDGAVWCACPLSLLNPRPKPRRSTSIWAAITRCWPPTGMCATCPQNGSVDPENGFDMTWEVGADSRKHVKAIADALKDDNALILATDPDREGEAISWHLEETLRKRKAIKKDTPVSRVVFNAITKTAVTEAMKNPREVDDSLVEAYLARRALDYLVGFNLSPVLWRKLPGARSAGRVQSVCLRLIVEREMEIEAFNAQEYWSVKAQLSTPRGKEYEARLVSYAGKKLDKFDLADEHQASLAVAAIESRDLTVKSVEAKPANRNPSAPFMTSTLQQEASRKFGMGARQTMSAAQRLYEAGLITYMRTDGIDMAPEAVMAARDAIKDRFGEDYIPNSPRMYKNKAKNAQEAHECIRPTDMTRDASKIKVSDPDQRKLYDLIWKRTLACQMSAARLERTTVEIESADGQVGLRASGQVVLFDGFLKIYEEGRDDVTDEGDDKRLPQITEGDAAKKLGVTPEQHFTQPPPRFTEATLVKRMEELGIGRPSTYASIVTTIQDREYVCARTRTGSSPRIRAGSSRSSC
jgi:DNA topoisomerase I/DNA protecting protein DprA